LLVLLLLLKQVVSADSLLGLFESFYRTGSLVWGGGPVVLPMLLRELVPTTMDEATFLNGFVLIQALPGPNFNLSAYLGGVAASVPGALIAWVGLFLPGLLLILASLPFWAELRASPHAKQVLRGVNAAASGLVGAATLVLAQSAAVTLPQQAIAVVCFSALKFFGAHPGLAMALGASLGLAVCSLTDCAT